MPDTAPVSLADLPALLQRFPSLQGLAPELQARLASELHWLQAPRTRELFAAGERCLAFPLLLAGEVQVVRTTPDGHEIELYRLRPGESCIVSTSCLLGEALYPARAQALAEVVMAVMPQVLFDAVLAAHPPFRRYVFALFAERLAQMMQRVEDVAFRSLARRIAALLLEAGGNSLDTTHERLAAQIGASREAVSRTLKRLEDAGCLRLTRGRIEVTDRGRLAGER